MRSGGKYADILMRSIFFTELVGRLPPGWRFFGVDGRIIWYRAFTLAVVLPLPLFLRMLHFPTFKSVVHFQVRTSVLGKLNPFAIIDFQFWLFEDLFFNSVKSIKSPPITWTYNGLLSLALGIILVMSSGTAVFFLFSLSAKSLSQTVSDWL